jgi:signal transduction histidine kinase
MTKAKVVHQSLIFGGVGVVLTLFAVFPWLLTNLLWSNYMPHGFCFFWNPRLVALHVTSDMVTGISYLVIAASLGRLVSMTRRDIPFQGMFLTFGVFILACGFTHFMAVVVLWYPLYWLEGDVKLITACASAITAAALPVYLPRIRRVILGAASSMENERRLHSVLESTSDQVVTIGHDWTMLYANQRAMAGIPDFRIGKNYWASFPAVIGTAAERALRAAMAERTEQTYEIFFTPYGRWFRAKAFPVTEGITVFFSDVTEEKHSEEQMAVEQLLREKRIEALTQMAAGLAHEISNPLAIIHGLASDLVQGASAPTPVDPTKVRVASEGILKTANRASNILRGLRGFAREAAQDPMEPASVYEIVDQCVELQRPRLERHDVDLSVRIEAGIPDLLCREVQIGQILTNLLDNAFDAITQAEIPSGVSGRWIALSVTSAPTEICIDVTDSGPGIEDHFKAHLMEPFFTTKELGLGMGVGLSLSRAIAQDHHGTLTLLKDTERTTFRLTLPLASKAVVAPEPWLAGVPA